MTASVATRGVERTRANPMTDRRPLIAHIVFSFDYGGLENGVVNVVNGLPEDAFRHCIIALTTYSEFRDRIRRTDAAVYALNKKPGKDPAAYVRLFRLLKTLRPAIVHSRNLGTLDCAVVARLAGVPYRIHGEHGWDVYDPDGTSRKYRVLRRLVGPTIGRFVTVSRELEEWLTSSVGIRAAKVTRICNGVDTQRFHPAQGLERDVLPATLCGEGTVIVGSVTRFSAIKDPLNLVHAFIAAHADPAGRALRLVMIGDGALRAEAQRLLDEAGVAAFAWLPGSRDDVAGLMRSMDLFALGSRREGISNTVLEAMATGLPVIASGTGGNLELVVDGVTGTLVPPGDSGALARVLLQYARDPELVRSHGRAARTRAEQQYSLKNMMARYEALYRAADAEFGEVA